MTTKEKPNVPISCEYDHLEFVPKQFGGTQDENGPEKKPKKPTKTKRPYAELRAASAFSFLDGASLPEDLVYQAAEKDLPAMALVDTNGVYGAPRFYTAAKKAGVRALVGAELVLEGSRGLAVSLSRGGRDAETSQPRDRATLLVENRDGYKNLCKLITAGAAGR